MPNNLDQQNSLDRNSAVTSPMIDGSIGQRSAEALNIDGFDKTGGSMSLHELPSPLS